MSEPQLTAKDDRRPSDRERSTGERPSGGPCSPLDPARLREVVGAIPEGSWMSYADVVAALNGEPAQARALNQRFIRTERPPGR